MKILIQKEEGGTMAVYTSRDKRSGGKSSYSVGVTPEQLPSVVAEHLRKARPVTQLVLPQAPVNSA